MAKQKKIDDLKRSNPTKPKQVLILTLPIPLTQNHMYINRHIGRRFIRVLNGEAQKWMDSVRKLVIREVRHQKWHMEENDTWYTVEMLFFMPDKITRDNHNCFKLLFDTLEGVVYKNDYYIMPNVLGVYLDRENPRVEIKIKKNKMKKLEKSIEL